jgi:WD40-like Beta Propeller Repeat
LVDPTPTTLMHLALYAYRRNLAQPNGVTRGQVFVEDVPGASGPLAVNNIGVNSVAHPSIADSNGHLTMVYDVRAVNSSGNLEQGDIGFCLIFLHNGGPCGLGQGMLPPLVNSARDETRPAFTPDGRYIGFIRDEANGHERVYVFDTETQTLIDSAGADLGPVATLDTGNLSLYEKAVFRVTNLPNFGTLSVSLISPAPIGLLVQRVVGHHRLLARRVPTLKTIGRSR